MNYIVIDPCSSYPLHMMNFVRGYGLRAIAVFTDVQAYQTYSWLFKVSLGEAVVDEYLLSDWGSVEELAEAIRRDHPGELGGIIPWDELTIRFGAQLSEALGIDWNSPETIACFRDKYTMKDALRRHGGVRINPSAKVESPEEALAFQRSVGTWPIVVKPTEGAGSAGVFFARDSDALISYAEDVFHRGMGEVLLEAFIEGVEYVVNGMTDADGTFVPTDAWVYVKRDVGDATNLYFQTIKLSTYDPQWLPLTDYAASVIHALGLRKAPCHMELKMDKEGPCLIEVGARFAGGNQPLLASELHGRSLFELAACHYLDDGPISTRDLHYDRYDSRHARIVSGVQTWTLDQIHGILGEEEVKALPSFYGFGKLLRPGMSAPKTRDMMSRSYEVYLLHPDKEQIAYDAEQVRSLLRYI